MAKIWDIAEILGKIVEGEDPETVVRIAQKVAKHYPEKAPLILRALRDMSDLDESHVTVTTARALNNKEKEKVREKITKSFGDVTLDFSVNEDIIGGVIIQNGETIIDNSIKSRINQLMGNLNIKY